MSQSQSLGRWLAGIDGRAIEAAALGVGAIAALTALTRAKSAVIVSDVILATGLGPSAVKVICEEQGDIATIFVTATPDQCRGCEPDMIIEKPPQLGSLLSFVRWHQRRPQAKELITVFSNRLAQWRLVWAGDYTKLKSKTPSNIPT